MLELFIIIWIGLFLLAVIGIPVLGIFIFLKIHRSNDLDIRIKWIINSLNIFAVFVLLSLLYNYYNNNLDMIELRGLFRIGPKFEYNININCGNGILNYKQTIDYNKTSFASGAENIKIFAYVINNITKKIIIDSPPIHNYPYFIPENTYILKKEPFTKDNLDLYVNPQEFSLDEYKLIVTTLKEKAYIIEDTINKYKGIQHNNSPFIFSRIFYYEKNSLRQKLNRTFRCSDNISIGINLDGIVFSNIPNHHPKMGTALASGKDIYLNSAYCDGKTINNGKTKQLIFPNTIIQDCYDSNHNNLFDEYLITVQPCIEYNHSIK